jgi:hypothetical protein
MEIYLLIKPGTESIKGTNINQPIQRRRRCKTGHILGKYNIAG